MTYDLYIGDYAYSSWSMRAWLVLDRLGADFRSHFIDFSINTVASQIADLAPAKTVPTLQCPDGSTIWDSLAIAEELADRHPKAGLWPHNPAARVMSRNLAAEMHSGFAALRQACPMNLRLAYSDYDPAEDVLNDVARIETIWMRAREEFGNGGPWLCGQWSIADAFYAPVAARIAGHGLPVGNLAADYVATHLADPGFRRWRAMGLVKGSDLRRYAKPNGTRDWPGPEPLSAQAAETGPAENEFCPYSGKTAKFFMETDGRKFGFCNAFCRDKTVADPEAWPEFMALL